MSSVDKNNVLSERKTIRIDQGQRTRFVDHVIEEMPIAMLYNGVSHAVMMATPHDLADFAYGFSLTEGIVSSPADIRNLDIIETDLGIEHAKKAA